jgi:hypothetical protein
MGVIATPDVWDQACNCGVIKITEGEDLLIHHIERQQFFFVGSKGWSAVWKIYFPI